MNAQWMVRKDGWTVIASAYVPNVWSLSLESFDDEFCLGANTSVNKYGVQLGLSVWRFVLEFEWVWKRHVLKCTHQDETGATFQFVPEERETK